MHSISKYTMFITSEMYCKSPYTVLCYSSDKENEKTPRSVAGENQKTQSLKIKLMNGDPYIKEESEDMVEVESLAVCWLVTSLHHIYSFLHVLCIYFHGIHRSSYLCEEF